MLYRIIICFEMVQRFEEGVEKLALKYGEVGFGFTLCKLRVQCSLVIGFLAADGLKQAVILVIFREVSR